MNENQECATSTHHSNNPKVRANEKHPAVLQTALEQKPPHMSDGHQSKTRKNLYKPKEITAFERKPGVCNLNTPQLSKNPKVRANTKTSAYTTNCPRAESFPYV